MLLSLILTPILMVFGFIVGMTIFRVTSGLLLGGFLPAMMGALGNANVFVMALGLIAALIFMCLMLLILVERSFSLVTEFPSRVLNWIGGRTDLSDSGALERTRTGMIGAGVSIGAAGGVASKFLGRKKKVPTKGTNDATSGDAGTQS